MRIIIIILFCCLSILNNRIIAQTLKSQYDLGFQEINKCKWSWLAATNRSEYTRTVVDSGNSVLKIGYGKLGFNKKMSFVFSKVIILPVHERGKKLEVEVFSKIRSMHDVKFSVYGLDSNEVAHLYGLKVIKGDTWKSSKIGFELKDDLAIKINLAYSGDSLQDQTILIKDIKIKHDGKDISMQTYSPTVGENNATVRSLDKKHLIPLEFNNDTTLFKEINEFDNRKFVGIGECTHGSLDVRQANYQFIKNMIISKGCQLVLLEKPLDMVLKWDLYTLGILNEDVGVEIQQEAKCFFGDYVRLYEFLQWLRFYNQNHKNKVHIAGIDDHSAVKTNLFEYYKALLGNQNAVSYYKLLKDQKYESLLRQSEQDQALKNRLGTENYRFYQVALKDIIITEQRATSSGSARDSAMFRRVKAIADIYSNNKISVINAHSLHLNTLPAELYLIKKVSLGVLLKKEFGSKYYSISFQVAQGFITQDECSPLGRVITDTLKKLPVHSFEYAGLKTDVDYFFYPSRKLGPGVLSRLSVERGSRYRDLYPFSMLDKQFDAYVFIKKTKALENIETFPAFYTGRLRRERSDRMNRTFKELNIN